MDKATRDEQAAQATTTTETTQETQPPRPRRGRGRRRLGRSLKPVYPMKAYLDAASEEDQRRAHLLAAIILEYWTGVKTKPEAAKALNVPPIRVWQMSQRAATGLVCALLKPPSGKRGAPMARSGEERELAKRNAELEKENALLRELVSVLRELPGNRGREIPVPPPEVPAKEAEATKPRRKKSREPRALPQGPGVASPPSS